MTLAWGTACVPIPGQTESGDRGVVVPFPGGALVAVIDGLGHGEAASHAASVAERVLVAAPSEPVEHLVQRCHAELRGTRGAVLSLASFDDLADQMCWLGVGNVEGFLIRDDAPCQTIVMRGGTVGYHLPPLTPRTLPVRSGDTLVFATDGIRHGFKAEVRAARSPQEIADEVVRNWSKHTDDVCVVVARYAKEAA